MRRPVCSPAERCRHRSWTIWTWRESVALPSRHRPCVPYIKHRTERNTFSTSSILRAMWISIMRSAVLWRPATAPFWWWMQHRALRHRHWPMSIWHWIMIWMFSRSSTRSICPAQIPRESLKRSRTSSVSRHRMLR